MKTTFNTVGEFEEFYAKGSGVTVEWLHEHGRQGGLCTCDYVGCYGWAMYHVDERNRHCGIDCDELRSEHACPYWDEAKGEHVVCTCCDWHTNWCKEDV